MNLRCKIFGHTQMHNDSGYSVCHCGSHSYYDPEEWERTPITWLPRYWFRKISYRFSRYFSGYFSRCSDCGKWEMIFGERVGDHDGCLPF